MKEDQKLRTLLFAAHKSYNSIFYCIMFIQSDATYSEDHLLQKSLHKSHNNYGIRREIETLSSVAVRTQRVLS